MEIGDYVRTEYGIAKYISDKVTKYGMYYVVDKDIMTCNVEGWQNCLSGSNEIIKSSPRIIDLIQVGDYVNGLKVQEVNNEIKGFGTIVFDKDTSIMEDYIYSIVTNEQFNSMEYKIGDK